MLAVLAEPPDRVRAEYIQDIVGNRLVEYHFSYDESGLYRIDSGMDVGDQVLRGNFYLLPPDTRADIDMLMQ